MKLLLYSLLLWLPAFSFAAPLFPPEGDPPPIRETIFYAKNDNPDWLVIREGVQITAAELVRSYLGDLGLSENDALVLYRSDIDDAGFTHYRYHQYHRGVRVDGAELLIHEYNGRVRTLNGKLVWGLHADVQTPVQAADAIQFALAHLPAERYMWQDDAAGRLLRRLKNDPSATFYPQPELVLVAPGFTRDPAGYQAAWRMIIHAGKPNFRIDVFVSAQTGAILEEVQELCTQNTPGTAQTKYSGAKAIITDSLGAGIFRLAETTRGNGIETYNMQTSTEYGDAVDFIDADNHWNNVNAAQDEAATDAHWGAEMTYDYLLTHHNQASLDDNDLPLIGFVHFDQGYDNAFWNGNWATYGDGSGNWEPLTSLDVVAHEYTHGLTDFTADLRYRNESGALNESFSDIFGTSVEIWADPPRADWLIGEDFVKNGKPLRNMADPKSLGDPDTYKGEFWESGTYDNGGVHINSGVQNRWFFLLTKGGSGRNDNNKDYSVTGIGQEAAAAIAFRNLKYYLLVLSDFADAREGALQAAEDIFGPCSVQYIETANAWYAVGVGKLLAPNDLKSLRILDPQPLSCGLGAAQPVSVQFRYNGCNADLQAGEKIPVAYQVNNYAVVWDTLTLAAPLSAGDTLGFTFAVPAAEFATPGSYVLRCWTQYSADLNADNNEVGIVLESLVAQNVDMRMQKLEQPASSCLLGIESPEVEIGFWGCDFVPANTPLQVFYSVNGGAPVSENILTPKPLYTGESFRHTFSKTVDLSADGAYDIQAWVRYSPDFLATNDTLYNIRIVNPEAMIRESVLTFEAANKSLDSVYTVTTPETRAEVSTAAARTGAYGARMTGGDIDLALLYGQAQVPNASNVWEANENFRSRMCVCVDLSDMSAAELRFDHKQTFSYYYLKTLGYNAPYASSLRVLINGEPISPTYKPFTHFGDAWKTRKFDLEAYLGTSIEICFETLTGINPERDTFNSRGDQVLLDNIAIAGPASTGATAPAGAAPEWTVMPNPGAGLFTVAFQAAEAHDLRLEVTDALGRIVRTRHTAVSTGNNMIPLNLEGMPAGVYFVRLGLERAWFVRKIVLRD